MYEEAYLRFVAVSEILIISKRNFVLKKAVIYISVPDHPMLTVQLPGVWFCLFLLVLSSSPAVLLLCMGVPLQEGTQDSPI